MTTSTSDLAPARARSPGVTFSLLRVVGSLWYAAVLLVLLLVAMACATVYESAHGTEQALVLFYRSWWFATLLGLLAGNIFATLVVRYPFSRRQIGFVLTHVSVLVTLAGALITASVGTNGHVSLLEGQTVRDFRVPTDTLTIVNRASQARATAEFTSSAFRGFKAVDYPRVPKVKRRIFRVISLGTLVDYPRVPELQLESLQVEVNRYLPDSVLSDRLVDDDPHVNPAIEVSFSPTGRDAPTWLFANEPSTIGSTIARFRLVDTEAELAELLSGSLANETTSDGIVEIEYEGTAHEISLAEGLARELPVGDTGYTVRILRYLPHASVGPDRKLTNVSDDPINPAIEVELTGPDGVERLTQLAFAKYPDFGKMHGGHQPERFKVTFAAPGTAEPALPIEVLGGPNGEMHVRFRKDGGPAVARELTVGVPIESSWPGRRFAVLRRFDHARTETVVAPREPVGKDRTPAVRLKLISSSSTRGLWLQKYRPSTVAIDGSAYDLTYGDKAIPLGFEVTLNRFNIGRYPGTMKPRSFESHVSIVDPHTGLTRNRVISMNNPTHHGGYTLYQSGYKPLDKRSVSFLSVARDPGKPVVFAGYVGIMAGMIVVLGTRIVHRRSGSPEEAVGRAPDLGRDEGQLGPGGDGAVDDVATEAPGQAGEKS